MNKLLLVTALTALSTQAFAEVKGEISATVGRASVDISGGDAPMDGSVNSYGVTAIVPFAKDFGAYLSYTNIDGTLSAGGALDVALSGTNTVVGLGYSALSSMDRVNYTGAEILVGAGMMKTDATISVLGVSETSSDTSGAIFARLEGYLAPKFRGTLSIIADTTDFDPTYTIGLGYDVGPGVLRVAYASDTVTDQGLTLKQTGFTFGYAIEF